MNKRSLVLLMGIALMSRHALANTIVTSITNNSPYFIEFTATDPDDYWVNKFVEDVTGNTFTTRQWSGSGATAKGALGGLGASKTATNGSIMLKPFTSYKTSEMILPHKGRGSIIFRLLETARAAADKPMRLYIKRAYEICDNYQQTLWFSKRFVNYSTDDRLSTNSPALYNADLHQGKPVSGNFSDGTAPYKKDGKGDLNIDIIFDAEGVPNF